MRRALCFLQGKKAPPAGKPPAGGAVGKGGPVKAAAILTEVSSNRQLDEEWHKKCQEFFSVPQFPYKGVLHNWRFFIKPGKAATGPPLGQQFTEMEIKPMDFCKAFNDKTAGQFKPDLDLIVRIQVYRDKSYLWRVEAPPTAWFIMRAVQKKRRETGPLADKAAYCAMMTLEMCYEIAKYRANFLKEGTAPLIEDVAYKVAIQAQMMGIAIIGVNTPPSPVKGMTQDQYEAKSEEYRKDQWERYQKLKQAELDKAPLLEKLHSPNVGKLPYDQLVSALAKPGMLHQLWAESHPNNARLQDLKRREHVRRNLCAISEIYKDLSNQELKALFLNWKLPTPERMRQLHGIDEVTEQIPNRDNLGK